MKYLTLAVVTFCIIAISACTCSTCGKQSDFPEFPQTVKDGAENYIINKTGKDFFDKNIFPNLLSSKKLNGLYEMHYIFRMIDYDFVNEPIVIFLDSLGVVNEKYEVRGIPECLENEENCTFNIDEKKAIEIAKENNLAEGIRDWEVSFRWYAKLKQYVWHIISTKKEIGNIDSDMYKADGEEIIINPYSGEVLFKTDWKIN